VIEACTKAGKHVVAADWTAEAVATGPELDNSSYIAMLNACAKVGKHVAATECLAKAVARGTE